MTRAEKIERYRTATEQTLRQLEWCIAYLHRLRKADIADAIDRNRRSIRDRLSRAGR